MAFQLAQLTKNKPALYGLGAAAAVGGVVWYRKRQTAGASVSSTTTGGTQTQAGTAAFDSTGTDVATAIGNLGAGLQQQLNDYTNQLGQSAGAGAIPPSTNGSSGPPVNAIPSPPAVKVRTYLRSTAGQSLSTIAKQNNVSLATLKQLNPHVSTYSPTKALPTGYGLWLS